MDQTRLLKRQLATQLSCQKGQHVIPKARRLKSQEMQRKNQVVKKAKKPSRPPIDDSAREAAEIFSAKQRLLDERKLILKEKATASELLLASLLDESFVPFKFQKGLITGAKMFYIVDFYVPSLRLCIEADGGYHGTEEAKKYDAIRNEYMTRKRNLTVLRITNYEISELTSEALMGWIGSLKKRRVNYSPKYHQSLYLPLIPTES